MIRATLTGLAPALADVLRARLRAGETAASTAFGEALAAAGREAAPRSRRGSHKRPAGTLAGSIRVQMHGRTGVLSMRRYGQYVRTGTRPHEIANAFGRGPGFVVRHPGTRADDFLAEALRSAQVRAALRRLPALLLGERTGAE